MSKKFLLTTAIAYANGEPHIGHAFEFVMSDTIARYKKSIGEDVFFITGMDEHGQKIEEKAKENGSDVQKFVDNYANSFKSLDKDLNVSYDFFVRTSDKEKHYKGAIYLWNKLLENNLLEKRKYQSLYCIGCEEFKTQKDLNEKGECPNHLKMPEIVEEENWFFKMSSFSEKLKDIISKDEIKIYPESRKNEILSLIERGLEDVSFSRPKSKVAWGIPVPNDDTQVMYVWCDALSNYITAIGYGTESFDIDRWSNATHVIGKDILRFHAAIWPAMLLGAGLPLPKNILVHGFITSGGQKMSKTLGNVIDPKSLIEEFSKVTEFGGESLRFILLHEIPSFEDGDLTMDGIKNIYNAHLANGIGNLTSRIMKMATGNNISSKQLAVSGQQEMKNFNVNFSLRELMSDIKEVDEMIATQEPFKTIKTNPSLGRGQIESCLERLGSIASRLAIFMPQVSAKIIECIKENKMPERPLFQRL